MMQKGRKFTAVTDNLNKHLQKSLANFSNNVAWADINNWLLNIEVTIRDNPSPFIGDKINLSKRLNQCLNPALPPKVHDCVIRIHQQLLQNMRNAVDGNINDYIKLFAEDLGLYSVGLFPFFAQTSSTELRVSLLQIINNYYMDLGKELIPLLPGLLISILPVRQETLDEQFRKMIDDTLDNLLSTAGRRYFIGSVWMCVLRFERCRTPGMTLLQKIVPYMKFTPEEEELEESHGFSDEEEELKRLEEEAKTGKPVQRRSMQIKKKVTQRFSTGKKSKDDSQTSIPDKTPIPESLTHSLSLPLKDTTKLPQPPKEAAKSEIKPTVNHSHSKIPTVTEKPQDDDDEEQEALLIRKPTKEEKPPVPESPIKQLSQENDPAHIFHSETALSFDQPPHIEHPHPAPQTQTPTPPPPAPVTIVPTTQPTGESGESPSTAKFLDTRESPPKLGLQHSEAQLNLHEAGQKAMERKLTMDAPKEPDYQTPHKYSKAMSFAGPRPDLGPVISEAKSLSDSGQANHDSIHVGPTFASADHHQQPEQMSDTKNQVMHPNLKEEPHQEPDTPGFVGTPTRAIGDKTAPILGPSPGSVMPPPGWHPPANSQLPPPGTMHPPAGFQPPPGFKIPPNFQPPPPGWQPPKPPGQADTPNKAPTLPANMPPPPPGWKPGTTMPPPPPGGNFQAPPPGWKPPADFKPPGDMPPPPGMKMPTDFKPPPPGWKPPSGVMPPPGSLPPLGTLPPPPPSGNQGNLPPPPPIGSSMPPTGFPPKPPGELQRVPPPPPQSNFQKGPPPPPFQKQESTGPTPNIPKMPPPPPPPQNTPATMPPPPIGGGPRLPPGPPLGQTLGGPIAPPIGPPSFQQPTRPQPPIGQQNPNLPNPSQPQQKPLQQRTNNLLKPTQSKISQSAQPSEKISDAQKHSTSVEMQPVAKKKIVALDRVPYVMTPELEQIKDGINDNTQENNYPNQNTLVLNALISCLEDKGALTRRAALDFMYSHLRLRNKVMAEADKKVLVEVVLNLFVKKELTITKRVNGWLFGKPDEQNKYLITDKNEFVIDYIINGFQKILSKEPKDQTDCILPLKILQNFYMQHDHMVKATLSPIVLSIVRYIYNFGQGRDYSSEIMKAGQRFFENVPSYYCLIFESLGDDLLEGLEADNDLRCFEVVKYIDFCYIQLMKHEFGYEELEYLTILMIKLGQALLMLSDPEKDLTKYSFVKGIVLLIVNLLDRKDRINSRIEQQRNKHNQGLLEQSSSQLLPKQRIEFQHQMSERELRRQRQFTVIASNIEKFYIKLGRVIRTATFLHPYEEIFKLSSLAITKIQKHLPKVEARQLPAWFEGVENAIRIMNPAISLAAIEAMIYCLTAENVHPVYSSYRNLIVAERNKKVGNDYQKQALQKLWSLLDFPHMHKKIIDLIVNFSKYFPYEFTQVVSKSFQTHNVPQKQASIQRFSHFWRLTGFKYRDILSHSHQLTELNKVGLFVMLDFLEDDNPLVRHAAKNWLLESMNLFYRVLDPLFLELMQVGDNIYQTPKGQYIISKNYDTKKVFSIFRRIRSILTNGTTSFLRYIYQTPITDAVDDSKSHYTSVDYPVITKPPPQPKVQPNEPVMIKEPVLPKAVREQEEQSNKEVVSVERLTYMDLLIIISVKYIKGQAIESMGIEFHVGNSAVNASSIEFLESFLGYIDTPDLCERFINFIMYDLFKVLEQGIVNRQYIIQVQLLNLFKTIFFNSSFRLKGQVSNIRKMFSRVFTNQTFMSSLLRALNTPFSYVRSQFISFISISVPLIADFLQPDQCTHCIKNILFCYYDIIKGVNMRLVKPQELEIVHLEDVPPTLRRIVDLKERSQREDKIVRLTDNLSEVAKTNQILAILHGVSAVLNYFFELDKIDYKKIEFAFSNPYTFFDKMKYVMTLTLANTVKQQKLMTNNVFLHNLETSESILKDIQPVFETILRAWPLSEEYVRIATYEFSEIGVKSFEFERFNRYNKVLSSLINYVTTQKESIWGKIISIMRPMFYKFPKQIVSIYVQLWIRECPSMDATGTYESKDMARTEFLMKIVQTLIVNDFPLNILVSAFLETPLVEKLKQHYVARQKDQKKGNVLEYPMAELQSKLIYFVHVYFHYVHFSEQNIQRDNLRTLWGLILRVIKPFFPSKNPNTNLWILEFIGLCSKKYSPKEILSDQKFKSELHLMINDKLKFVAGIASKNFNFFYEQPKLQMRTADLVGINPNDSTCYRIILPFTPSIYQLFLHRNRKEFTQNAINRQLFQPIRPGSNDDIERRNRYYSFKTLKKIGLQLIQNTYLPEKNRWIIQRTKEWIDIILPVIEDKNKENEMFAESASEVIHDLLDKARSFFLKSMKADLLKIFNKDDFFMCNVNTLKYWMKIIDWVATNDKTFATFREYLDLVALSTSFFSNQDADNKKRVKSFERICFLLYSGSKDLYSKELKTLLPKIAEILKKSQSAHPALLILILFAIRILIMRLSEKNLSELFTDIWPMMMTLLIQLFSRKLVKVQMANQISKNPNLLLAALKLIEMMSITNLIQFSNNQWIFIYDYFGLKLSVPDNNIQLIEYYNSHPELRGIVPSEKNTGQTPFLFKPYLTNYFPPYNVDYIPKHNPIQTQSKPIKRKLIITEHKVEDEAELRVRALVLCQYLININELRIEVDDKEVDMQIVNDFISLDHFIHKL